MTEREQMLVRGVILLARSPAFAHLTAERLAQSVPLIAAAVDAFLSRQATEIAIGRHGQ